MNLEAVYSNDNDHSEEMSFEELRALSRGWMNRDWAAERKQRPAQASQACEAEDQFSTPASAEEATASLQCARPKSETQGDAKTHLETTIAVDIAGGGRTGRPKKTKIMEVKGETQTSMNEDHSTTEKKLTYDSHDKS